MIDIATTKGMKVFIIQKIITQNLKMLFTPKKWCDQAIDNVSCNTECVNPKTMRKYRNEKEDLIMSQSHGGVFFLHDHFGWCVWIGELVVNARITKMSLKVFTSKFNTSITLENFDTS